MNYPTMIKANELRLGNNVFNEMTGQNVTVTGDILFAIDNDNEIAENYYPILLTPEILTKWLSFRQINDTSLYEYRYKTGNFLIDLEENILVIHFNGQRIDLHVNCKHLHTLQNLFFAITAEELNVTSF